MPDARGSGSLPVTFAHAQKIAVVELRPPAIAAIRRGLRYCEAMPASIIEIIITDQTMDSMVAKTRPRYSSETWRSNCDMFKTELTATAARESAIKNSATKKFSIWLKMMYVA